MLGDSRWQADEPTPQLVRPAVVAATTLGPNHTLLRFNCVFVCLQSHMFVCVYMCVSYQWEGVGDFAIRGQLSSKTVGRKELVTVIVLDNLTHCFQGHGICIHLVGAHIVKGSGLGGVTLEEDTHTQHSKVNDNMSSCLLYICFSLVMYKLKCHTSRTMNMIHPYEILCFISLFQTGFPKVATNVSIF